MKNKAPGNGKRVAWGYLRSVAAMSLVLAMLLMGQAVAQDVPPLPHAFYGTLLIEGEDAPPGTVVTAEVDGQVRGSIVSMYPGVYGSDADGNFGPGIEKLIVQGLIDDGTVIKFYVDSVEADQTHEFASGEVTLLILTVGGGVTPMSTPTPTVTPEPTSPPTPTPGPSVASTPATEPTPTIGGATPSPGPAEMESAVPTPTPAPAADGLTTQPSFCIDELRVSPASVGCGEPVTCLVTVTNTGEAAGTYTAALKIGGAVVDTREVALASGESRTVDFSIVREEVGSYPVEIDGMSMSFSVVEAEAAVSWALVGTIIAAVVMSGLATAFFLMWRRQAGTANP
jgi:hypothetical protein